MFRRKEDSLFDTPSDIAKPQESFDPMVHSVQMQQQAAMAASMPPQQSPQAAMPQQQPSSALPSHLMPRTAADARPTAPAAAVSGTFRPTSAAPIGQDMSRNRMPEAKPTAAPAPVAGSGVAPAAFADKNKSARRVLTVGNDILLKGEIATCDRLVIEGKVDATLNDVHTVEIAEFGSFKGCAHIEEAEISGLFEGELIVRGRLIVYSTGKVRGKISYGEIEIERGGEISGEVKSGSSVEQAVAPRSSRSAVKHEDKILT